MTHARLRPTELNQGNPGEHADRLARAALEARATARDATGEEKTELLAQATLDAALATFFELRRINIGTEEYVAALRKHAAWLEEHHGALGSHGRALQTQAQAMERHSGALHEFEREQEIGALKAFRGRWSC